MEMVVKGAAAQVERREFRISKFGTKQSRLDKFKDRKFKSN
jgi:hypothetical protein